MKYIFSFINGLAMALFLIFHRYDYALFFYLGELFMLIINLAALGFFGNRKEKEK